MLFNSLVVLALLQLAAAQNKPVSKNARCGQAFGGQTCQGSKWGNCCSQYNYCGSTKDYCDVANKCQKDFGTCNGQPGQSPVSSRTTLSTSVRVASSIQAPSTPSPSASNVQNPPGTCSAITVTKSGDVQVITQIATLPATTITLPAITETLAGSIVTLPAVTETLPAVTETLPAVTETLPAVTETLPAVTETLPAVTETLPALTETLPAVTETLPAVTETLPAVTETLPAVTETLPAVTETLPAVTETLPAVTETLPAVTETLPALTETLPAVTETLPAVTETLPAVTETLPAVTETLPAVTETLPAVTETLPAITLPASTVTQTASASCAATCPTGNPVLNGNFESTLAGSWTALAAGDADIERVSVGGANGVALRARINSANGNLPQRIIQAVTVCPGVNYRVSFDARRTTTAGTVSAVLYVNDTPLAGGTITATSFQAVTLINSGIFSTTLNSVTLRVEFTYSGSTGTAKEVQIDNVVFTRL